MYFFFYLLTAGSSRCSSGSGFFTILPFAVARAMRWSKSLLSQMGGRSIPRAVAMLLVTELMAI